MNKLKQIVTNSDIRNRLVFTILMLMVFCLGTNIPVPGINHTVLQEMFNGNMGLFDLFDLFSGGSFSNFTVFALGVTPYITATIIVQLLGYAFPRIEQMQEEGMEGQKRLTEINRRLSVILALIQAAGLTFGLFYKAVIHQNLYTCIVIVGILVAGSTFLMWIGEQIEEYGIGNGMSLLIFAGIAARIPTDVRKLAQNYENDQISAVTLVLLIAAAIVIVAVVVLFQKGERPIPVTYAKRVVGKKTYGGDSTHIPMKVNSGGVMPIIFSISILQFPITIAYFVPKSAFYQFCNHYLSPDGSPGVWIYSIINIVLTFAFTYFYQSIIFKPDKISRNLAQAGGFIPGVRPGAPTERYLKRVSNRMCFVGGIYLAAVETLPMVVSELTPIDFRFGGTSLLILIGVALDTASQIEGREILHHRSGFLMEPQAL